MKKMIVVFLMLFCIPAAFAAAGQEDRPACQVCGMYIDEYQKTAGKLEYNDGKLVQSCGLACLLRLVVDEGGPDAFKSLLVKDFLSEKTLQAQEAIYVLSSKIIPDMLPSIIAFQDRAEAQHFKDAYGGELVTFSQALLTISPTAMTMPARIKTAVLPAKGSSGIGLGVMQMKMDTVKVGSDSVEPGDFIERPGQMMGPKEMKADGTMLMGTYGVTDTLTLDANASYLDKEMEMYTMGGNRTVTDKNSGLSDVSISLRYNFLKSIYYNHFTTLLAEVSLPTGDFEEEYIAKPGLQMGTGDFTFGGGLLYTYRYKDFWLHSMAGYTHKLENSDNFKFGDEARLGVALHYTPNYDVMVGVEADTVHYDRNELDGDDVGNSGGSRSMLTGVASWRFLTALGGNFNLRLTAGLPLYEDLNHTTQMGMESVQLGGGWFGSVSLSFKRRFASN
ncbi:MAG: nitrous oxide reductase accessory protein NosL [Desulfobulbaceae bacterium]|nr:nitrous oxide reductase accessory protein NosL [Desulfobulbaceae bacterium]